MTKETEELIRQAAEALVASGAKEVYLFGSAAQGTETPESDIDLAVSGLPPEVFFRAMGHAWRILHRPVDLVDLDEQNPFTEYLKSKGVLKRVA